MRTGDGKFRKRGEEGSIGFMDGRGKRARNKRKKQFCRIVDFCQVCVGVDLSGYFLGWFFFDDNDKRRNFRSENSVGGMMTC